MTKWEYLLRARNVITEEMLAQLGDDGWEAVMPFGETQHWNPCVLFKRPKEEKVKERNLECGCVCDFKSLALITCERHDPRLKDQPKESNPRTGYSYNNMEEVPCPKNDA